jgi:2-dehydropantoate 2-reductase
VRILIVGAGAVGGYFGGLLTAAGRDVTFLVRPRRAAALARDGLRIIRSGEAEVTVAPAVVTTDDLGPGWDLVLLSVKAYGLDAALDDLAGAIDERTAILPALNGLRHIDMLRSRFGDSRVLGVVAFISAHLDDAGRIVEGGVPPALTYGELDGGDTPRIRAVDDALRDAGFHSRLSFGIVQDLWEKWVFLAAGGVLNTLVRGTVGEAIDAPGGEATARAILAETAAVAAASGFPARDPALERAAGILGTAGSGFTTSMYKDLLTGRQLEDEQIVGDLVERAGTLGVPVPLLTAARAALAVAERRRTG